MRSNRFLGCTLIVVAMVLPVGRLFGDGCFVWNKAADLNEPSQKAILCHRNGVETMILQVKYEGPAEDFAWIVPLPAKPEVTAIDPEKNPFAEISLYTQRRARWGWRGMDKAPGEDKVTVLERKVVGVYDVAVLAATEAGALGTWLNKNGYVFPESHTDVLEHYTKKQWYYVAMRIDRKALQSDEVRKLRSGELQPIRFTFAAKDMVYPLKISSVNAGQTELLLYVLGDVPMVVAGQHKEDQFLLEMMFAGWGQLDDVDRDPAYGTYRKANGSELPLTWEALGVPPADELFLCKYRAVMKTFEMNDDLLVKPFDPVAYWKEQLRKAESSKATWQKHRALAVLAYHDAELLQRLAKDDDKEVRHLAAGNRKAPADMLRALARDADVDGVRVTVARNPSTPAEALRELAAQDSLGVREGVAGNPSARDDLLRVLANDKDRQVRVAVARNACTPAEILGELADDKAERVRHSVSCNPKTPAESLRMLARDPQESIRWAVLTYSPHTPLALLAELAEDADWYTRACIAANKRTEASVLAKLVRDKSMEVRCNVALNPATAPESLQALAKETDATVRAHVGVNPHTAIAVLRKLAQDKDVNVRLTIACNYNTPEDVLRTLAEDTNENVAVNARRMLKAKGLDKRREESPPTAPLPPSDRQGLRPDTKAFFERARQKFAQTPSQVAIPPDTLKKPGTLGPGWKHDGDHEEGDHGRFFQFLGQSEMLKLSGSDELVVHLRAFPSAAQAREWALNRAFSGAAPTDSMLLQANRYFDKPEYPGDFCFGPWLFMRDNVVVEYGSSMTEEAALRVSREVDKQLVVLSPEMSLADTPEALMGRLADAIDARDRKPVLG